MEKVFLGVLTGATKAPEVIPAVRGVLDFIYYVHFEMHSDDSLSKLERSWISFHKNKDVFKKLGIREHYNISKLHNIKHYLESIRSLGTADGYNTESSERLHIDLAKCRYLAGNKKNYIPQMTKWLQRQEAVHHFDTYLKWAIPGYKPPDNSKQGDDDGQENEQEEQEEEEEEEEEGEEDTPVQNAVVHSVALRPSYKGVPLQSVVEDYGALDLVACLNDFLGTTGTAAEADETMRYSIYKRTTHLPPLREVSKHPLRDTIYASKATEARISMAEGIKEGKPAKFSTALIRTSPQVKDQGPMSGISVGQIRLIFELPSELRKAEEPLVYVHWMTPLREPQPDVGMYKLSFSTHNLRPRASVVPLNTVLRSCHLIPVYGARRIREHGWTPVDASFYLNPYLHHYNFFLLRYKDTEYWEGVWKRRRELEAAARRAEERRVAKRKKRQ